jgi:hypothetical protein
MCIRTYLLELELEQHSQNLLFFLVSGWLMAPPTLERVVCQRAHESGSASVVWPYNLSMTRTSRCSADIPLSRVSVPVRRMLFLLAVSFTRVSYIIRRVCSPPALRR